MGPFTWDASPVLLEVGRLGLRWYSVLFVAGLVLAAARLLRAFRVRGWGAEEARRLAWVVPLTMLVGAHLVHLVFYEPRSFVERPWRILDLGHGLASHGGALGTILGAVWLARRAGRPAHAYLDAVMVAAVWLFPWVRVGNFMNSEILGRVTEVPWGVLFARVDAEHARHPVQLYEAAAGIGLIALAEWMEARWRERLPPGAMFYSLLGTYFAYRFVIEFWKDAQGIDDGWALNMGHLLSVGPLLYCAWKALGPGPESLRRRR